MVGVVEEGERGREHGDNLFVSSANAASLLLTVFDNLPPNLELPWIVVDGIEDKVRGIAVAEEKVKLSDMTKGSGGDADIGDMSEMEKRVVRAQQQEYNMNNVADDYVKMEVRRDGGMGT